MAPGRTSLAVVLWSRPRSTAAQQRLAADETSLTLGFAAEAWYVERTKTLTTNRDRLEDGRLTDGRAVRVGHVQTSDAASLLRYLDLVSRETDFLTFGSGEFPMTEEEEAQHIERIYATATGVMLKAVVGDEIVSVAGLQRTQRPRIRHVGTFGISVIKRFWGTGVARVMCERALSEAVDMGIRRVELKVREDNLRALRLYNTLGFFEEGRLRRSFVVDDRVFDELTMAILLDERDERTPHRVQPD